MQLRFINILALDALLPLLILSITTKVRTYRGEPMNFFQKLREARHQNNSMLCIGLDPDPRLMPPNIDIFEFNRAIIDATADLVCAYKPNFAFYESMAEEGLDALHRTILYIPDNIPVIGDAKRSDIGNTARAYARAIFLNLSCDATTVNPYLGSDSVAAFTDYSDRGVFILCLTSNTGASDFQLLECNTEETGLQPLYKVVARMASQWNRHGNIGLVVGATYTDELKSIRYSHPDMPILIPGIGAQGGNLAMVVRNGVNDHGGGIIINSSRQVLYASKESDFARAARHEALSLRDQINSLL